MKQTYHSKNLAFDRGWIGKAALAVADTLQAAGYDGYLVGGCVRDLLLHRPPKDFDVATDARPERVKKLFRRARIVGRRFKIVHVRVAREVVEVATYRAKPKPQPGARKQISRRGRVLDDNMFGTIEQDAARRDFTINALFYDPRREAVLDYQGGVADARANTLRVIGDARARFTEDPVRILRALRFRAKLGLVLQPGMAAAIAECAPLLDDIPPPRLFDEMLKMFHYGHARKSWRELAKHNLLSRLFPLTPAAPLIDFALANTDQRVRENKPVISAFLFAVLLWRPYQTEWTRRRRAGMPAAEAAHAAGDAVFQRQAKRIAVPRRVSGAVIEMWEMQPRLEQRRPKTVPRLLISRRFRAAYDLLLLRQQNGEVEEELTRYWTDIQQRDNAPRTARARPKP